jgi:hypothetical protein
MNAETVHIVYRSLFLGPLQPIDEDTKQSIIKAMDRYTAPVPVEEWRSQP